VRPGQLRRLAPFLPSVFSKPSDSFRGLSAQASPFLPIVIDTLKAKEYWLTNERTA
jgi:hypothetical protein